MSAATTELLGRALAEAEGTAPDSTEQRILDATLQIAAAAGFERVTMDDVAARAGVGRMTVYRRFRSKEGLLAALTVREARRGFAEITAAVDSGEPADQVADGFVAALRVARKNPLVDRLVRFEPQRLLATLNDPEDPLLEMLRSFVATGLGCSPRVAELFVRIGLSFLLVKPSVIAIEDEEVARELALTMFAPLLDAT